MKPLCRSNRNLPLCISWLKTSRCCRNLFSVSNFQTIMPVFVLVIITGNPHWVWHKPSELPAQLETCTFSHELMQGSYALLAVKLFNKAVSFDSFHCQVSGNSVWNGILWEFCVEFCVEWSKIPLGWCEMASPELQTPSARAAPASHSPV